MIDTASLASAKASLEKERFFERLLQKDPTLWPSAPLGWIDASPYEKEIPMLEAFAKEVRSSGFTAVASLGMGGSSLTAGVLFEVFGAQNGLPIYVLDSTDPGAIAEFEKKVDITKTLFIVASKTGTTIESVAFQNHFLKKLKELKGDKAGENFVAITDDNTILAQEGWKENFRKVFTNASDIGGRYSGLSFFGLVPAALLGIDLKKFMSGAKAEALKDAGIDLGLRIGVAAAHGQDKLILKLSPAMKAFGMWIEQLLAESTGKSGKGIVPIHDSPTNLQGADCLPLNIEISDPYDLGKEFLKWEIATVVAGRVLGINPLDQPNVQQSKDFTQQVLSKPAVDGIDQRQELVQALKEIRSTDYVGLMAFTVENKTTKDLYQQIRRWVEEKLQRPTTLGFGPRFLHSTGQLHKGGPKSGLFIQFDHQENLDFPIPGKAFSFGTLKKAQAQGDLLALKMSGQKVFSLQLGKDPVKGLSDFLQFLQKSL